MKHITWLGILAGLGVVVFLGYTRQLPASLQTYADRLAGWTGAQEIGETVRGFQSKLGLPGDGPGEGSDRSGVKPAPRKVKLPDGPFVPLALAIEKKRTHLVYLENGKVKSSVFGGVIVWEPDTGVSRIYIEKQPAPLTGPNGEKLKGKRKSHIQQLRRFEYSSGDILNLHPHTTKGIVLEPEDLTYPDEYKAFFLEENRTVLSIFDAEVVLGVHRATFLGGAHPMETVRTERIELESGGTLSPRFELERTSAEAGEVAKVKGESGCVREHQGSVALRGPGGTIVPAAVLGAAFESCRGKLAYSVERTVLNKLVRKGITLGEGATFRRSQVFVGETPILKGIADVIVLDSIPGVVAIRGDRFTSPLSGRKTRKAQMVFKAFDRSSKAVSLARVTPLIGSISFEHGEPEEQDLQYLKQIFEVKTVE